MSTVTVLGNTVDVVTCLDITQVSSVNFMYYHATSKCVCVCVCVCVYACVRVCVCLCMNVCAVESEYLFVLLCNGPMVYTNKHFDLI